MTEKILGRLFVEPGQEPSPGFLDHMIDRVVQGALKEGEQLPDQVDVRRDDTRPFFHVVGVYNEYDA